MQPMASSIHIKDDNYLSQDEDQMDDSNEVYNDYQRMQPKYTIWKSKAKVELKAKFADNLRTRVNCIENAVDKATQRIITDNLVPIMQYPEHFRVTTTIKHEALERMNHIIDGWGGVDIAQCEKLPTEYKRYWRLAHNWWNRQKGKWFGDLLFWPVFQYNLVVYCNKILINNSNEYHYSAIYNIFLCDIIYSEVQFKKSRPVPLVFDLALQKSCQLTAWLKQHGNIYKFPWDLSKKPQGQKGVQRYARAWCKFLRDKQYKQYMRYEQSQLDNDLFTIDNNLSIAHSTESKTDNDNDQNLIHALGQNGALPEPVKPRDPPHPRPHSRMASTIYPVHSGTTSYNGNGGGRLPPNYHRPSQPSTAQFQTQSQHQPQQPQQQQRAPSMSIPMPINRFLPRPRRRGQLYYLLEMKENKPLTQRQLDELSQQSYISMHTSIDHDMDDTSSTTFNGHQPSTPSTTAETPRSISNMTNMSGFSLPIPMNTSSHSHPYSNGNMNNQNMNRPTLRIYDNNHNHNHRSSSSHRLSTMSLLTNPSFLPGTSNRHHRKNYNSTNGPSVQTLSAHSNAMNSIHQNNNTPSEMKLDAQCHVFGTSSSTNIPYMNHNMNTNNNTNSHQTSNIPPPIEINQMAMNLNPPNHHNGSNVMQWNEDDEVYPSQMMSICNAYADEE